MNKKIDKFIKNFSYTFIANLISMIISIIITLVVPKLIGVEEYGYWQLYIFYTSYVGFLHFGWSDGAYLRYGGYEYDNLKKSIFVSQFWIMTIFEIIISIIISFLAIKFSNDYNKTIIIILTCICGVILILRSLLYYILQATNRIKEFAIYIIIERVLYFFLILLLLLFGLKTYKFLIIADLIAKLISLFFAINSCRELVFGKITNIRESINEIIINIKVGINLMLANIASIFIIGIVRIGIQYKWNIETFGKVSLTLSISNLLMVFINAIGIVMFPMLRRTSEQKLSKIYKTFRTSLTTILFGMLVVYYPLKLFLLVWLPQYIESLNYMALLFPICIFESKISMLINTYLKSLRKEKLLLFINVTTALLSLITTTITVFLLNNLLLTILSIVFLLAFRCIYAEILLAKILKINIKKDLFLEIILTSIFIITGWFIDGLIGLVLYLLFYFIYLIIKKKEIIFTIDTVKTFSKKI